jgi:hypothetical protein
MESKAIFAAMGLSVIAGVQAFAGDAAAADFGKQVYTYTVSHPVYGNIGTYTDTIDRTAETIRIDGCLRVAVKVLGVVAYRMESDTTEILRGDRLVSLQSATNRDGERLEVHGEARGEQFVVNTTSGSFAGPADIAPTDPWLLKRTGDETVVFTDTGRIFSVQISGGDLEAVSLNGTSVIARHFIVMGVRRQEVWLDNREIPIRFRVVEDGTPIDFLLQNPRPDLSSIPAVGLQRAALARPDGDDR